MTVRRILDSKGRDVATVDASLTVAEAAKILASRKIGALLSLGESGNVIGIISERDVVRLIGMEGASALQRSVASAMTKDVTTASEETTIDEAMEMMTDGRFRHLPVCEGGVLVGIVSIGDVVKRRIEQVEQEAENMRTYIHAG